MFHESRRLSREEICSRADCLLRPGANEPGAEPRAPDAATGGDILQVPTLGHVKRTTERQTDGLSPDGVFRKFSDHGLDCCNESQEYGRNARFTIGKKTGQLKKILYSERHHQ